MSAAGSMSHYLRQMMTDLMSHGEYRVKWEWAIQQAEELERENAQLQTEVSRLKSALDESKVSGGITPGEAAEAIRQAADAYLNKYSRVLPDLFFIESDVRDFKAAAEMIEKGDFWRARHQLNSLDTIVRDEVPPQVWKYLEHTIETVQAT